MVDGLPVGIGAFAECGDRLDRGGRSIYRSCR
jgi:hypothetical protein